MQETQVLFLGWEDFLEKEGATHSSIPTWEIPWTEEPGGLHSVGLQELDMTEVTEHTHTHTHTHTTYLFLPCWLQLPMSTTSSQSTPGGFTSFLSEVSTPMIAFKCLSNASNGGGHPGVSKLWLNSLCLSLFR